MFLMKVYLRSALLLCKITGTPVSFLLHPLDIIGGDKLKQLAFFPGMKVETDNKVIVFKDVLKELTFKCNIVSLSELINDHGQAI